MRLCTTTLLSIVIYFILNSLITIVRAVGEKSFEDCKSYGQAMLECQNILHPHARVRVPIDLLLYPHMVLIGFRKYENYQPSWKCGGSLISASWVLTAAHCAEDPSNGPASIMRIGTATFEFDEVEELAQERLVAKIVPHPEYKPPSKYHDIALMMADRPFILNRDIRIACLPMSAYINGSNLTAIGFGKTVSNALKGSQTLMKVDVDIIERAVCNRSMKFLIKRKVLVNGITENQLCAGDYEHGGRDTCQGDSGGPLQFQILTHIIANIKKTMGKTNAQSENKEKQVPETTKAKESNSKTISRKKIETEKIKHKLQLARHILEQCQHEEETDSDLNLSHVYTKAVFYTGMNLDFLTQIYKTQGTFTFKKYIVKSKHLKSPVLCKNYQSIRKILLDYYVNKRVIPSVKSIITSLVQIGLLYTKGHSFYALIKSGFILTRLPKTNIHLIVENPDIISKRMRYLEKIKHYRETCRDILYLENRKLGTEQNKKSIYIALAVLPKSGFVRFTFYELPKKFYFIQWVSKTIIPNLPPFTVIIIDTEKYKPENIPTSESLKSEVIDWLTENKITFDVNMHKAELLNLVEKFKGNGNSGLRHIDDYFKGHGHEPIHRPSEIQDLIFYETMWKDLMKTLPLRSSDKYGTPTKSATAKYICECPIEKWVLFDEVLAANEENYYQEDIKMEEIVDKLKTMAKYDNISEFNFASDENCDIFQKLNCDFVIMS